MVNGLPSISNVYSLEGSHFDAFLRIQRNLPFGEYARRETFLLIRLQAYQSSSQVRECCGPTI